MYADKGTPNADAFNCVQRGHQVGPLCHAGHASMQFWRLLCALLIGSLRAPDSPELGTR